MGRAKIEMSKKDLAELLEGFSTTLGRVMEDDAETNEDLEGKVGSVLVATTKKTKRLSSKFLTDAMALTKFQDKRKNHWCKVLFGCWELLRKKISFSTIGKRLSIILWKVQTEWDKLPDEPGQDCAEDDPHQEPGCAEMPMAKPSKIRLTFVLHRSMEAQAAIDGIRATLPLMPGKDGRAGVQVTDTCLKSDVPNQALPTDRITDLQKSPAGSCTYPPSPCQPPGRQQWFPSPSWFSCLPHHDICP